VPRITQQTLSKLSTPTEEGLALDLEDVKRQRRLGSSTAMARLLNMWIRAATSTFEEETGRQVRLASFEYRVDCFPPDRYIEIPKAPLRAVTSVAFLSAGSPSVEIFDADNYTVETPRGDHAPPGRIVLKSGASWPTPVQTEGAVVITFQAGYAATVTDVPALVSTALLYLVGHFHKYGEEVIGGPEARDMTKLPLGAGTLMFAFKKTALPKQRPWEVPWLA